MFNLICVLVIALLGCVGFFINIPEAPHVFGYVFFVVSGVWMIASFFNNLSKYNVMLEKFEDVRASLKNLDITIEKRNVLLSEFKLYLADKYPEHEKEIFKLITETNTDVHVILKYPEIKSSETIMELVQLIEQSNREVYDYKYSLERDYAKIRFYKNNLWYYLRPTVPLDIVKHL